MQKLLRVKNFGVTCLKIISTTYIHIDFEDVHKVMYFVQKQTYMHLGSSQCCIKDKIKNKNWLHGSVQ